MVTWGAKSNPIYTNFVLIIIFKTWLKFLCCYKSKHKFEVKRKAIISESGNLREKQYNISWIVFVYIYIIEFVQGTNIYKLDWKMYIYS